MTTYAQLVQLHGSISAAARELKMHRKTFSDRLEQEQRKGTVAIGTARPRPKKRKDGLLPINVTGGMSDGPEQQAALRDALSVLLRKRKTLATVEQLADTLDVSPARVRDAMEGLRRGGHNITIISGGGVGLTPDIPKAEPTRIDIRKLGGKVFRFGVTADNHLGSLYARDDVLNALFDIWESEGITTVYQCGNMIDGEARFNRSDLLVHGMEGQARYFAKHWPQRKGMTTYYVTGDDHEGWYCFGPEAEILTRAGWKKFAALAPGEDVATRSEAGEFEWQAPTRIIRKPHVGPMIRFKHRSLDVRVTPDHRMLVRGRTSMHAPARWGGLRSAEELLCEFRPRTIGIVCSTEKWSAKGAREVVIPRWEGSRYAGGHPRTQHFGSLAMADAAELIGWFASEGCYGSSIVSIAQAPHNAENCERIAALLTRIGARFSYARGAFRVCSPELGLWLVEQCGDGSQNKRLPGWLKEQDREALEIALDALVRGDGTERGSNVKFYSHSRRLLDDVCEIAAKLGYGVTEHASTACRALIIRKRHVDAWLCAAPTVEPYAGDVFCVAVPNGTIYVRSNGKAFWSGNCQRECLDIGRYLSDMAQREGRKDVVYLGHMEHDIEFTGRKQTSIMRLLHAGGGSSYAISYAPQKIVESYGPREKPHVLLIGHYHKAEYLYTRAVHVVQAGTTMDQSPFMRKNKLQAHVGGWIVEMTVNDDGVITRFKTEWLPFFDRDYYAKSWSYKRAA